MIVRLLVVAMEGRHTVVVVVVVTEANPNRGSVTWREVEVAAVGRLVVVGRRVRMDMLGRHQLLIEHQRGSGQRQESQ